MEIHFELGDLCLLKCKHCSSSASGSGIRMKYSEQDMIKLLKGIREEKEVFLTGGEPLLFPDLERLLSCLQKQIPHLTLGMFTAGIVGDTSNREPISGKYAKALAQNGLKMCYLSVYSHNPQEHDWMTGIKSSFEMLDTSIHHLKEAGIEIRFHSVVTARNAACFDELISYAENTGASEVRMLKLLRHGRACDCWEVIGLSDKEYRAIACNNIKRKNGIRITASGLVDIFPCRYLYPIKICPAGKRLLYITSEGDVYPCASVKKQGTYRIGNIVEQDISKKCFEFEDKLTGALLCRK